MDEQLRRLRAVLAGQTFPAERWELLATAEFYGADARTRAELRDIPAGRYLTIAQVAEAACAAAARSGAEPEPRRNGRPAVGTDLRPPPPTTSNGHSWAHRPPNATTAG
ncbi:DUF2795 domain-containing protein [Pseudonocardia sp.]|uniref:DUF2795 domain-containing protein n=1 Tax=Pseudonocardia sp. TaxID=60912 RepID=UPI003D10500B